MTDEYDDLPLVYSCSGCSSAAQTATADREVVAIDGCPLQCAKQCLDDHDVTPTEHYVLSEEGVPKEYHTDYDEATAEELFDRLREDVQALQ